MNLYLIKTLHCIMAYLSVLQTEYNPKAMKEAFSILDTYKQAQLVPHPRVQRWFPNGTAGEEGSRDRRRDM